MSTDIENSAYYVATTNPPTHTYKTHPQERQYMIVVVALAVPLSKITPFFTTQMNKLK